MFGLGVSELIIILVIVVIIFGAKKLPGIGSGLGEGILNFRKAMKSDKTPTDQISETNDKEKKES